MKIIIYGIGKRFYNLFFLEERIDIGLIKNRVQVAGFSDGNPDKWGKPVGYEKQRDVIKSMDDFLEADFDKIVVTTKNHYEEIRSELMQKGYKREQIIAVDEILEANPEMMYYEDHGFFQKQWEKLRDTDDIKVFLGGRGYKKIAVYGTGEIAEGLTGYLENSEDITIEYFISPDKDKRGDNRPRVYGADAQLPPVNLIIIAELEKYMEIERIICERNLVEVISIQELVYKALKNARRQQRYA